MPVPIRRVLISSLMVVTAFDKCFAQYAWETIEGGHGVKKCLLYGLIDWKLDETNEILSVVLSHHQE